MLWRGINLIYLASNLTLNSSSPRRNRRKKLEFKGSETFMALHWHHNQWHGVSNHLRLDCLPNRSFRHRSKKTSRQCVTGLCEENPPVTGGFPSLKASNAGNVSVWWHHHEKLWYQRILSTTTSIAIVAQKIYDVQGTSFWLAVACFNMPIWSPHKPFSYWPKVASCRYNDKDPC